MSAASRPYYHEFAWAYDLLQTDPVDPRVDFMETLFNAHGINTNSAVLDAGCGTGRYAVALAKRGYQVCGVDRSPELIAVARNRAGTGCEFMIADLLDCSFPRPFDAVLCRGVLNDFLKESDREVVFRQFAKWLRPAGVLIFDVREWARTVIRYEKDSIHQRTVNLPDGTLRFQSETRLDHNSRQLHVQERFYIQRNALQTSNVDDFVMGCWTCEEISKRLHTAGFTESGSFQTYGESDQRWSDRLVIIAQKDRGA